MQGQSGDREVSQEAVTVTAQVVMVVWVRVESVNMTCGQRMGIVS